VTNFNRFLRKLPPVGLTAGVWLSFSGTAWAAEGGSAANYVFPYFFVIFFIILGSAIAFFPSRRRDKAKPDEYVQKKII